MGRNFIVLRSSPDWRTFDMNASSVFCRQAGFPENTIIDFAEIWNRTLKLKYHVFRERLKDISQSNISAVCNSRSISHEELKHIDIRRDDRIAFTDDDDWYAPDIFDIPINEHGAYWGSVRLGLAFGPSIEQGGGGLISLRPIVPFIYTNNYIVSGQALAELGFDALFEHTAAHQALLDGRFRPLQCIRYASCTNKTPASALSARFLLALDDFRRDPGSEFRGFASMLNSITAPACAPWMQPSLDQLKALMNETVRGI